jgi:hypothetical protein
MTANLKKVHKRKEISQRLASSMMIITLIGMGIVTGLTYFISYNVSLDETLSKTQVTASYQSEKISSWFDSLKMMAKTVGGEILRDDYTDKPVLKKIFADTMTQNPELLDIGVGYSNDLAVFAGGDPDFYTWLASQRSWYISAMQARPDSIVTPPFVSGVTGDVIIIIARYVGKVGGMDTVL